VTRSYRLAPAEPIAALNRVKLVECGEPLVDLREHLPGFKVLRESAVPWARLGIADRLREARKLLHPYDIGLREAWRSVERQRFIYDRYFAGLDQAKGLATRRRLANRFFAPYDQKAPPGHSTGAAVDLWLLDRDGESLDLNGPGERFRSAPTFSPHLPKMVREMRLLLYDALIEAGFTNCRDEWWHYSYGDAGWAVRAGESTCIYGSAEPPLEEYVERDRAFIETFLQDPPF
jgi:D-alanyl-D-alanine dipeptidase